MYLFNACYVSVWKNHLTDRN